MPHLKKKDAEQSYRTADNIKCFKIWVILNYYDISNGFLKQLSTATTGDKVLAPSGSHTKHIP
jgi:hypothetical protein